MSQGQERPEGGGDTLKRTAGVGKRTAGRCLRAQLQGSAQCARRRTGRLPSGTGPGVPSGEAGRPLGTFGARTPGERAQLRNESGAPPG